MKKRLITLLLAASMVMSGLTGCGNTESGDAGTKEETGGDTGSTAASGEGAAENGNFNEEGYPIVNEEITLKVMFAIRDSDTMIAPEEMPSVQRLDELTGIKTEWEVIKSSDWTTKLNLMFTSGEYPDVIIAPNGPVDDE